MPSTARYASILLYALFLFTACSPKLEKTTHRWFGMDTDFSATLYESGKGNSGESGREKKPAKPDRVFAQLERESARLEQVFSDYLPGSSLSRLLGRMGDTLTTEPEIMEVFRAAEDMAVASQGSFDITLHDLKIAWGLSSDDSNRIPTNPELAVAMRGNPTYGSPPDRDASVRPAFRLLPDNRLVLLRDSAVFDLGGIAKGYVVDRLHALLDSLGHPNHIVTAGGDLRVGGRKGKEPWVLGIRHPRETGSLAGTLKLDSALAISTSGDYERFFIRDGIRYHHIFDPRTGMPSRTSASVTVLAATSLMADRLTKPLFILGPEKGAGLLRRFGAKAVWMREIGDGKLCYVPSEELEKVLTMRGVEVCKESD
ncbi:MAG: FAD:protein FMN transferase [Fibrobacterota bacterium]|nr:FAD:protein FMN transferase [Fibrobacterota bacterium]